MEININSNHNPDESYVYNGTEVILTGRAARRSVQKSSRRTKKSSNQPVETVETIYEIKPADPESIQWVKWVKIDDLFKIQNN